MRVIRMCLENYAEGGSLGRYRTKTLRVNGLTDGVVEKQHSR
jgi:hypothetical protein